MPSTAKPRRSRAPRISRSASASAHRRGCVSASRDRNSDTASKGSMPPRSAQAASAISSRRRRRSASSAGSSRRREQRATPRASASARAASAPGASAATRSSQAGRWLAKPATSGCVTSARARPRSAASGEPARSRVVAAALGEARDRAAAAALPSGAAGQRLARGAARGSCLASQHERLEVLAHLRRAPRSSRRSKRCARVRGARLAVAHAARQLDARLGARRHARGLLLVGQLERVLGAPQPQVGVEQRAARRPRAAARARRARAAPSSTLPVRSRGSRPP